MYVFSIYDTVAEDWSTPFCAKNVEHLKRVLASVFKQGIVLEECYVQCFAWLNNTNGTVVTDDDAMCIFENGLSHQYLSDLFANELKEKEVKKNGK